ALFLGAGVAARDALQHRGDALALGLAAGADRVLLLAGRQPLEDVIEGKNRVDEVEVLDVMERDLLAGPFREDLAPERDVRLEFLVPGEMRASWRDRRRGRADRRHDRQGGPDARRS